MTISIIVITHNRAESLEQCIKSLLNQTHKYYEIIVIDDGSTDNTKQTIRLMQKKYKIIKYFRQEHKGKGSARNLGLRKARGNIVAFTDDDCIVPQNWLESIKTLFKKYSNITAAGGAIVNGDKTPFGEAAYILNFSSWFPTGKKKYLKDIPTANVAYKKEFIRNKTFPEDLLGLLDYEDTIFNFELVKKGQKILFDPSIKILHQPGINDYKSFIKNQHRKGLSFALRGHRLHGLTGRLLIKLKFLNLFCPRLTLIFLRCLNSSEYLYQFIIHFPLILRGELERGLIINKMSNRRTD